MHLNISQQMRMSQQMKLAPRMIQSMEILQLPLLALQERIEQELADNIVLEQTAADPEVPAESNGAPLETEEAPKREVEERELNAGGEENNASDFERLLEISQEWPEDNYTSGSKPSGNRVDEDGDRQHDLMANAESRPQTLHDYLIDQFHYFDCSPTVRAFGEISSRTSTATAGCRAPCRRSFRSMADPSRWRRPKKHLDRSRSSIRPASAPATSKSASSCRSPPTRPCATYWSR
jgi:hypothetical protein